MNRRPPKAQSHSLPTPRTGKAVQSNQMSLLSHCAIHFQCFSRSCGKALIECMRSHIWKMDAECFHLVGKEADLVGKEVDLVGKEVVLVGKEVVLLGKEVVLLGIFRIRSSQRWVSLVSISLASSILVCNSKILVSCHALAFGQSHPAEISLVCDKSFLSAFECNVHHAPRHIVSTKFNPAR